jgi:histidine kinase
MTTFLGYELMERLHDGDRSTVVRAKSVDGSAVVLKFPSPRADRVERVRALRRELETLERLNSLPSVVKPLGFASEGSEHALLLEDLALRSLRQRGVAGKLALPNFLELALGLAELLDRIHARGVLHGDFHIGNVLCDERLARLQLIDFCNAGVQRTGDSSGPALGRRRLDGKLAYFSPEQTGRFNRRVDHRSDYYALGVTLFELLTGCLPFPYTDSLELLHAQLARRAPHPSEFVDGIPDVISSLVLRLLSKEANDRYLDAASLRAALLDCQEQLRRTASGVRLSPARRAKPARVEPTLHGRAAEIGRLEELLSLSCEGEAVFVIVRGPAGVGKSALVRPLVRSVIARGGHFAAGKFEQYGGALPHSGLSHALQSLAHQLLTYEPSELALLRAAISAEMGEMGGAVLDLCPALVAVIGEQPKLPQLPARETRARLQRALSSFVRAVADPKRPLCFLLDDVHWASSDSIALVNHLLGTGKKQALFVAIALRDGAFPGSEALEAVVSDLAAQRVRSETLELAPLGAEHVRLLVDESVSLPGDAADALAAITWSRTQGNPFFVRAFLDALHADGLISNSAEQPWIDIERIRQRSVTDNVLNLLIERINRLPPLTQEALKVAACLGGCFELEALGIGAVRTTADDLWPAVKEGLVLRLGPTGDGHLYMFAHDRIQQVANDMLSETERQRLHLAIGRRLLLAGIGDEYETHLFEVVKHLNIALGSIADPAERVQVAELNLRAARQALSRAAGGQALAMARVGVAALAEPGWREHYELSRALHLLAAEAAFAWAEHDILAHLSEEMVKHARDPVDAARVRRLEGRLYQAQARSSAAVATYVAALASLGIELSCDPTEAERLLELEQTSAAISGRTVEQLVALQDCADESCIVAMELLGKLIFFAYSSGSRLFEVAVCRLVRMSLERGAIPDTANGFTFYGLLLSQGDDYASAEKFANIALALSHRFGDPSVLSQAYLYVHYQIMHWRVPLRQLLQPLRRAYEFGLAAGSPLNAGCSATTLCICRFWAGDELGQLEADMEEYRQVIIQFRQSLVQNWHEVLQQAVHNLRSPGSSASELAGPIYVESERYPIHRSKNDGSALFNYHMAKTLLCYLFGEHEEAVRHADACAAFTTIRSAIWAIPAIYLDALARLAVCDKQGAVARQFHLEQVQSSVQQLSRLVDVNPSSVRHKLLTIQAELARVSGDDQQARVLFARAVDQAAVNGSPLEEGLACELAARFSGEVGQRGARHFYARAAHRAFSRWGAAAKVARLEAEFAEVAPRSALAQQVHPLPDQVLDELDLVGVLNITRAISSEIRLEPLLRRMMSTLKEVAGAQTALLLTRRAERWTVEAHADDAGVASPREEGTLARPTPPASIVNYVAETGETLLLNDASLDSRLAREVHSGNEILSLVCFPLRRGGELVGIVYLENNLARGAFSAHNIRLLELISAQAVVAIENARVYDVLEREVNARTTQLQERNQQLAQAVERLVQLQGQLVSAEKLAALGLLTAGIAHEIKNPLNFVVNFASESGALLDELLDLACKPARRAEDGELQEVATHLRLALTKIAEHGSRANDIIGAMALHARDGGGKRERVSLNRTLAQSVALASHGLRAGGNFDLTIDTDFDARVGEVEMVVEDMSRVFLNVISNARHAVEEKGRRLGAGFSPQIVIITRDAEEWIEIRVRDNGIGIPNEALPKILLPFFTTKASGQGTGLGLSISSDIVRAHGGELKVESVEDDYTEVTVLLSKSSLRTDRLRTEQASPSS